MFEILHETQVTRHPYTRTTVRIQVVEDWEGRKWLDIREIVHGKDSQEVLDGLRVPFGFARGIAQAVANFDEIETGGKNEKI